MEGKTVLIIEDSYTSYLLIAETLKFEGYEIQYAVDVSEALTLIANKPPDLIILDLNMPEMTGYDFLSMKEQLGIECVPVIVVSALDSPESKSKVKTLGGTDFIPKPVNLKLLIERVKSLIA